jgi:hypothetical protein
MQGWSFVCPSESEREMYTWPGDRQQLVRCVLTREWHAL